MRKITEIGVEPKQDLNIVGENNEKILFTIEYKPTQSAWYFSIVYAGFSLYGQKLLNSPNILRQFKNALPFGIMCEVVDGSEPYFVEDFREGRCNIYILNESDVLAVEESIF